LNGEYDFPALLVASQEICAEYENKKVFGHFCTGTKKVPEMEE